MSLLVEQPSVQTSVQAAPFRGHRHLGMPSAGPADALSLAIANAAVGNAPDAPGLEIVFGQAVFIAQQAMTVSVAGAPGRMSIGDQQVNAATPVVAKAGDRIAIGRIDGGCRRYLAVAGGLDIAEVLGSRSTYLPAAIGGFEGRALRTGDIVQTASTTAILYQAPDIALPHFGDAHLLRIVPGPESHWIDGGAATLAQLRFSVGRRADRMGLQMEGLRLVLSRTEDMPSSAVFPGTIQCPPDGRPILLGPDAQTTGGYPRIAQVIRADRHLIGQIKSGDRLNFVPVTPERARAIYREKITRWRAVIPGLRLD